MAKSSIGLYISSKNVDIVELKGTVSAPHLANFLRQEIPIVEGIIDNEQKQHEARRDCISLAIKEALEKLRIKAPEVYTVLPSSEVMIRYFSMPLLPRSEQVQALKFEARKYIPFKADEIVSDFKLPPPSKLKKAQDVFFIAATKERLNFHIDIFKKAGTDAVGIDIIPFAIMRMLFLSKKISSRENMAILYLDNDNASASIHIIEKGMSFLSREFNIITDDKDALFERLASELRVSFDYYHRQNPQAEILKIIVCGETLFAGLDAFIADELKIITETVEQLAGLKGQGSPPPSFIISAGAALGGLAKSYYSVNLSPLAARLKKKKTAHIFLVESLIAISIVILIAATCALQVRNVMGRLNATREFGKSLPSYTAPMDLNTLKNIEREGLEGVKFLKFVFSDRTSWANKMDRIAKCIPDGVWVSNITVNEKLIEGGSGYPSQSVKTIAISGNAFASDASKEAGQIDKFFKSLKEDNVFMRSLGNIQLLPGTKKEISGYWVTSFKISAGENTNR